MSVSAHFVSNAVGDGKNAFSSPQRHMRSKSSLFHNDGKAKKKKTNTTILTPVLLPLDILWSTYPFMIKWFKNPQNLINYVTIHASSQQAFATLSLPQTYEEHMHTIGARYIRQSIKLQFEHDHHKSIDQQTLKAVRLKIKQYTKDKEALHKVHEYLKRWLINTYATFHIHVLLAILDSLNTVPELWYQRTADVSAFDLSVQRFKSIGNALKPYHLITHQHLHKLLLDVCIATYPAWWWYSMRIDKLIRSVTKTLFKLVRVPKDGDHDEIDVKEQARFMRSLLKQLIQWATATTSSQTVK
jgi:hypothetical protein